jgi:hypothetical protein
MWLMTRYGFFSVVLKPNGEFQVRARAKRHLEALKARFKWKYKVAATPAGDYGWRLVVPQAEFAAVCLALVAEITWDNFKTECGKTANDPAYVHALHDVWSTMFELQHAPA